MTFWVQVKFPINNFFLCTQRNDFNQLKVLNYNTVLLETDKHPDDGSLSWYALKNNIRYINIEAALGDKTEQEDMLNAAIHLSV